ncbi:MAG: helix-turn-helix domain-containing protein [Phascolarctobacterium sp.]
MLDRSKAVGKRIRVLRLQRCMSQKQLAQEIGITQAHLSNLECGHTHITLENLLALHDALRVRMTDFFVDIDGPVLPSVGNSEPVVSLNDMIEALILIKNKQLKTVD